MYIYPGDYPSRTNLINVFGRIKQHLDNILAGIKDDGEETIALSEFLENGIKVLNRAIDADPETPLLSEGQSVGAFYDSVLGANCEAQFIWPNYPDGTEPEEGYQDRTYISLLRKVPGEAEEADSIFVDITGPVGASYNADQSAFFHDIVAHTTFTIGHVSADDDGQFSQNPVMLCPLAYFQPNSEMIEDRLRDTLAHISFSMNEYQMTDGMDRFTPVNRLQMAMDIKFSSLSMAFYSRHDEEAIRHIHSSARAAAEAITGLSIDVEATTEIRDGADYVPVRMAIWYGNDGVALTILGADPDDIHDLFACVLGLPCAFVGSLESEIGLKVRKDTGSVPVGLVLYPGQLVDRSVFENETDQTVTAFLTCDGIEYPEMVSVEGLTLSEADRLRHEYSEPEHLAKTLDAVYERMKNAMEDIIETQFD